MNTQESTNKLKVRPYTVTGGRTNTEVELALETMLKTNTVENGQGQNLSSEKNKILDMATDPLSVAEISAYLETPIQVAKILIGDLVTTGHLTRYTGVSSDYSDRRPDLHLLERVLSGLQSL